MTTTYDAEGRVIQLADPNIVTSYALIALAAARPKTYPGSSVCGRDWYAHG